jgi:serine phosphatase RsbU (regulator of sigma subunit)
MDIVLIAFNRESLGCQFAGANNSLYWIRSQEGEAWLEEIKPDRMPVSIYLKMDPFTNHTLQLQKGDVLYLKTDGFEDQYSSVTGKKLLRKKLKDLLVDIYPYPLAHQEEILNAAFEVWKGDDPQTDDITLLGLKI